MPERNLRYWLLSDDQRAREWRATAPAGELARALVRFRQSGQPRRPAGNVQNFAQTGARRMGTNVPSSPVERLLRPADRWVSVSEAAELSGYHSEHVRRLAREGRIEARKEGHSWRIESESLARYVVEEGRRR